MSETSNNDNKLPSVGSSDFMFTVSHRAEHTIKFKIIPYQYHYFNICQLNESCKRREMI